MKLLNDDMQKTGGDVVAKMLANENVEVVFGIIDGTYMGLIRSLERYNIQLITPRHETSAAHMAGAYARVTGKLGVCIASNGPGVANILPGVAVEQAEGNRVLLITSCRRNQIIYPDRGGAYQYFNQTGVIGKMSKYSEHVPIPERLTEIMKQAFRISYKGRPGVVHVDIPENYINSKSPFDIESLPKPSSYRRILPISVSDEQIKEAGDLLSKSKFPVIHAGSGVIHSNAQAELQKIAEQLGAPVTTSWAARGAIDENHPLAVPMTYIDFNDNVRKNADLILTLGSRMGETDWWGKMPNWGNPNHQKMIQVDIDDEILGRNKPIDLAINADVKSFLQK
ncbi:MAG: thiamine pyrophosphate-binding protein, partial [Chitinophagales bacterium]